MHDLLAPNRHQPLLPRRTRRNVKQSRYGCLTCRARRKKCDEMKPVCLRCTNARRICEYTERAIQLSSGFSSSEAPFEPRLESLQQSNQRLPRRYSNQEGADRGTAQEGHLYELCFETFLQGFNRELHLVDQTELMQLFTQLSPVSEAVRTSMIYFGAVLGALNTAGRSDNLQPLALRNQNALDALQHEIATMPIGPAPVFVAGIVLAAAEVLVRRVTTALTHVRGAFMALRYTCEPRNSQALWSNYVSSHMSRDVASTIQMLALLTDIHVASYRLSEPPDLPQIFHVRTTRVSTTDTFGDDIEIVAFLHGCRHYISRAAKFRYSPFAEVPTALLDEQNRYFSILSCWLSESRLRSSLKSECTTRRLVTRAKCLSTLISVSTVLSPDEKAYDAHSKHFDEILEICERVLSNIAQSPSPSLLSNFQLQPGIFEPLYLTAMKYRHPYHRRRAIDMFTQLGLEGPWNATIMAEISRKAIEIEEGGSRFQSTVGHYRHNGIPEGQRVHHCSFGIPPLDVNKFPILVRAEFRLRTDVEGISRSGIECDGVGSEPEWTIKRERIEIKECFPTRSMN